MNDKIYNQHLIEIFNHLLNEDALLYSTKQILFNTYGLILFNNQPMSIKKRNKLVHGR